MESKLSSTCSSSLKSTSVPFNLSRCISFTSDEREMLPTKRGNLPAAMWTRLVDQAAIDQVTGTVTQDDRAARIERE